MSALLKPVARTVITGKYVVGLLSHLSVRLLNMNEQRNIFTESHPAMPCLEWCGFSVSVCCLSLYFTKVLVSSKCDPTLQKKSQ